MRLAPILAGLLAQVPEPPVAATVAWEVPPGCPDRVALIDAIERRLARPLASGEVEVSGQITLHPQTPRYRLKLRLTAGGRGGERTLTAERCPPLADATALLVALAADQATAGSPFPTGGTTVPATGEATSFAPNDEAILESADEPMIPAAPGPLDEPDLATTAALDATTAALDATLAGEELHAATPAPRPVQGAPGPGGSVRMGGGPELGGVPELTGTLGLAAGLLWRRARLEFHGVYLAPQTAARAETSVRVSVLAAAIHGCARLRRGSVEFPICGGLEFGGMRGVARGPGARAVTRPWLAGVVSAGVAWHARPRVTLSLNAHAVVRLAWPHFELRDPGPSVSLFEPAIVSGRLLAGLELRFRDPW